MSAEAGTKTIHSHRATDPQSLLKNEPAEMEEWAFVIWIDRLKLKFRLKWGGFVQVGNIHKG